MPERRKQVFLIFPFDRKYAPLFVALIFVLLANGYYPRLATECDNAGETRLEKLFRLMLGCDMCICDLSRKSAYGPKHLARANMALELGAWFGLTRRSRHSRPTLILETTQYDYREFVSDLAGLDIRAHGDEPQRLIRQVRDWLDVQEDIEPLMGGKELGKRFKKFLTEAPAIFKAMNIDPKEATNSNWIYAAASWLKATEA